LILVQSVITFGRRRSQSICDLIASRGGRRRAFFDNLRNGVVWEMEHWGVGCRLSPPFKRWRVDGMDWVDRTDEDAGPEAGVPTKAKWKMNCRKGVIGRLAKKILVLNYTHLHAFTRIYTHLHAFTRIYTLLHKVPRR